MKILGVSLIAAVVGIAILALISVGANALADAFRPTRELLIDNDPSVLRFRSSAVYLTHLGGLIVATAVAGFVACWILARFVMPSLVPRVIVSGVLFGLAAAQIALLGRDLWLCFVLAALWPVTIVWAAAVAAPKQPVA
jgi:hypothetical protein